MADSHASPSNNLPVQPTSFIGREREIAQVRGFLSRTRLLTLIGAGGVGKTRLAFQVADEASVDFEDGVWAVDLAPLADAALVPRTAASVLGVTEQPGRDVTETLVAALRDKTLLLVLDNCEHLRPACAHFADAVLRGCPRVYLLVTSREPLSVPGETLWRVPSLSLPDPGLVPPVKRLGDYEALRLFMERARARDPRFAVTAANARAVVQICRRLDGIPLAIELAASRTRVLAVEQIALRLDDRFGLLTGGGASSLPRHQTLRATMDWSYGLLGPQEQMLLRRLSVFSGGWTLEAAESVCAGDGLAPAGILDLLMSLVDKSLVLMEPQEGEARYRLLETVRQYGRDRLHDAGDATVARRRHRDWYLQLAERADVRLRGPEEAAWLNRLETEHDNLRSALEWSNEENDGSEAELRLAGALEWFWYLRGHWSEGRARLEGAIARSTGASPFLPKVLVGAGRLAYRQSDGQRAKQLFEKGLALCRELGNKAGMGWFLVWLGIMATTDGDYQQAERLLENSLVLNRELGDKWWTGQSLAFLGNLSAMQSDYERAMARNLESLALSRETGSTNNITFALRNLGLLALRKPDFRRAAACYTESLIISKEARYAWVITECLEGLARVACGRTEHQRAARLFGAAEASFEVLGAPIQDFHILKRNRPQLGAQATPPAHSDHDRYVASTRAGLGEAKFAAEWSKGRAMALEEAIDYALSAATGATMANTGAGGLTAREREVAALVAQGKSNREIAARLVVTERTAETHVQNILNKLGFSSRAQIAAWAVEQGLHATTRDR